MAQLCFQTMNHSAYILGERDADLPGQIRAAAAAGFPLFGPDVFSLDQYYQRGGKLEELAALLDANGMRCFEVPALMVGADTAKVRADAAHLAEIAGVLRPDYVAVNVEDEVDERVLEAFRSAGEIIGEAGARLAVEYLPWFPVKDTPTTRSLLERAAVPGSGILLDTWHFFHGEDDWAALDSLRLEEISYVQFDDHPEWQSDDILEETLHRRALPGEGVLELARFCEAVRRKGFDGVVSCEVLNREMREGDVGEFARRLYETSASFWP